MRHVHAYTCLFDRDPAKACHVCDREYAPPDITDDVNIAWRTILKLHGRRNEVAAHGDEEAAPPNPFTTLPLELVHVIGAITLTGRHTYTLPDWRTVCSFHNLSKGPRTYILCGKCARRRARRVYPLSIGYEARHVCTFARTAKPVTALLRARRRQHVGRDAAPLVRRVLRYAQMEAPFWFDYEGVYRVVWQEEGLGGGLHVRLGHALRAMERLGYVQRHPTVPTKFKLTM